MEKEEGVGIHVDKQQGETLNIWADNYWMMSHSANALGSRWRSR